jgi:Tfp pilus assembly protein PilX
MQMLMTHRSHVQGLSGRERERGAALVVALMATLLLSALGLALVLTTTTETKITGNYTYSQEAMYAADAAIERTVQDVLTVPDWNNMLSGVQRSAFVDGAASGTRTLPNGAVIDLTEATNMINCGKLTTCSATEMNTSTEDRPWGLNNPRYQLFAYGPSNTFIETGTLNSPFYVIVWVADDPSENDNDPTKDGNAVTNKGTGVITLRAEAWGGRGAHRILEVTLTRTDSLEMERGYTGQRGQDEQNRRARKAAVQQPGNSGGQNDLTRNTINVK